MISPIVYHIVHKEFFWRGGFREGRKNGAIPQKLLALWHYLFEFKHL